MFKICLTEDQWYEMLHCAGDNPCSRLLLAALKDQQPLLLARIEARCKAECPIDPPADDPPATDDTDLEN